MTRLLLLWLLQASITLTGAWQPAGYVVAWSAPEPACVTVQQPGGIETLAGACAASGEVLLVRGGDVALAADDGAIVRLRAAWGLAELARLEISAPYRVALPLISAERR